MTAKIPFSYPVRVADLPAGRERREVITPDAEALGRIAKALDLLSLRKVRLDATLRPQGKSDWQLVAKLGATATQPCVVTLAPVTTRIDTEIERVYLADLGVADQTDMPEHEITGDDRQDPLTDAIELGAVLVESLALALPDYPRADGAELEHNTFAAPGIAPLSDEQARPFAGLAGLRDKLKKDE